MESRTQSAKETCGRPWQKNSVAMLKVPRKEATQNDWSEATSYFIASSSWNPSQKCASTRFWMPRHPPFPSRKSFPGVPESSSPNYKVAIASYWIRTCQESTPTCVTSAQIAKRARMTRNIYSSARRNPPTSRSTAYGWCLSRPRPSSGSKGIPTDAEVDLGRLQQQH